MIAGKVTWLGIALAAAFWIVDAAMHTFLMHEGSLATQICAPEPMIAGMRVFPALLAIGLGAYAQRAITERQRAEAELRGSQERTLLIIEKANSAFVATDAGGRASRAGMLGLRPSSAGLARRPSDGSSRTWSCPRDTAKRTSVASSAISRPGRAGH